MCVASAAVPRPKFYGSGAEMETKNGFRSSSARFRARVAVAGDSSIEKQGRQDITKFKCGTEFHLYLTT